MLAARPLKSTDDRTRSIRRMALRAIVLSMFLATPWSYGAEPPREPGLSLVQAVRLALENDPEIHLVENQLESSRSAILSARGDFDPLLTSSLTSRDSRTPLEDGESSSTEDLETRLVWSQMLRSGQTLEPQLSIDRDTDAAGTVNTATLSFVFRQPLLRGRNGAAVQAFERSAQHELEAARFDLAHTTAERLLAVISQYWTVKTSVLDLEILRSTEASSRALLETTRRLIAAHLTPAADLVQLEADLVLREANRFVGERNLFQAVQQLGNELGLTAEQISELAVPSDPFPIVDAEEVPAEATGYLREALQRRADLRANRERLVADEKRLFAADDALKPRLDLVVTPSYSGLVEGTRADDYISPLWTHIPGLSTTFGFELSLPLRNHAAAGGELQARASVDRRALLIERDSKRIGSRVPSALETVRRNAERLERLDQAVQLFEKTVENETKKLRAGTSTLIDVISQRDRLTSALQSRNAAQQALAVALAELRFETGMLIATHDSSLASVRYEDFTTLPPESQTP